MSPRCSRSLLPFVALAACAGDDGARATPALPPPATAVSPVVDAGAPVVAVGVTTLPAFDPATGYHLDDGPTARPAGGRLPPRERKVAQILLRSSPSGALAAVDGVRVGPTPVLWEGLLDGQAREFTFVMAGHALARYRFVPVTSGIVHGTLVKLTDDKDAGIPEIPAVVGPTP
jgi:hypothetical protein